MVNKAKSGGTPNPNPRIESRAKLSIVVVSPLPPATITLRTVRHNYPKPANFVQIGNYFLFILICNNLFGACLVLGNTKHILFMVPIGVRGCLNLFPKTHYRRLDKDSHGLYTLTIEKQIILVV